MDLQTIGTLLVALLTPVCSAAVTYFVMSRHIKKETNELLLRELYRRKLDATQACYALLIATTDSENEQSIISYNTENGNTVYYFIMDRLNIFIEKLPKVFYNESVGLYLTKEIKDKLFEYRSILYGLKLKEKNNKEPKIRFNKNEVPQRLIKLHQEIIIELKKQLDINNLTK